MLTCTILTFAMCADPSVAAQLSFGDVVVPITWSHVRTRSCGDVHGAGAGEGGGYTQLETAYSTKLDLDGGSDYTGRLLVKLQNVHVYLSAFSWPRMTAAENAALRRGYEATLWHEMGHVRTALASVAAANAEPAFTAVLPSEFVAAGRERGEAAMKRIDADQERYDAEAEHGIRQSALPEPLRGPDTIVRCP